MKRDLEIVASIAEALNSAATVREALERTLDVIARELKLDTGWVWLVDAETGHIYSAAARNLPPYLQEPVRMTGGWCWCIEQFRAGPLAGKPLAQALANLVREFTSRSGIRVSLETAQCELPLSAEAELYRIAQ